MATLVVFPITPLSSDKNNARNYGWETLSLDEALSSLNSGIHPHPTAEQLTCILRKCKKQKDSARYVHKLHDHIRNLGLESHQSLGNHLIPMLVNVGCISEAHSVFDKLAYRNQASWSSLITGYLKAGDSDIALDLYHKCQSCDTLCLNGNSLTALLKTCAKLGDYVTGSHIHAYILKHGLLKKDRFVGTALVDMYAKCQLLSQAEEVFWTLPARDVVSWNSLIAGYAKHEHGTEALSFFDRMLKEGLDPTAITFVSCLKACGCSSSIEKGKEIHKLVSRKGLERDLFVGSALVDMYARCGLLDEAEQVLHNLNVRNVVSWTSLIKGYVEHCYWEEALNCFSQMQKERIFPDTVTFVCVLKACGMAGAIEKGNEIHAEVSRKGLYADQLIGCALIDMYVKCGLLVKAQETFSKIHVQDVAIWNALIAGYAGSENGKEVLKCFKQMQDRCIPPNGITFNCILKACADTRDIQSGKRIHTVICLKGLDVDHLVGSTLVDMYCKCGYLSEALAVFDNLSIRDIVSWTALILGLAELGYGEEALVYYQRMQDEGLSPNSVTFIGVLRACASLGAIFKGQEIHAEVARKGSLEHDTGNALVEMYAKCGSLVKAQEVFDDLPRRDIVSWNVLIAGSALFGKIEDVLYALQQMLEEGEKPNSVTFVSLLNACNHAGEVELGQMCFEAVGSEYFVHPELEHHTCMIDLLGRAGQVDEAMQIVNWMNCDPDNVVWHVLLGSSQKWSSTELGRHAFNQAIQLNDIDTSAYVSLSNIYTDT